MFTKRFILTGTPGAGKTSLIRMLETQGFYVVEEAATDIITVEQIMGNKEPWKHHLFIDKIIELQNKRQKAAAFIPSTIQFYDRSPVCTYALAKYLNFEISKTLLNEIQRIEKENIYQKKVFFIENLGFIEETSARKITLEQATEFESIHEDAYREFNYDLIKIHAQDIQDRVNKIIELSIKNNS